MRLESLEQFRSQVFLPPAGPSRTIIRIPHKKRIFSQGDMGDSVFYIQYGKVALSVVSEKGNQATLSVLGPGSVLGEECMAKVQSVRMFSAIAVTDCEVLRIDRKEMLRLIQEEPGLSNRLVAYLLVRNVKMEEELIDQFLYSSEQRLARTLLRLGDFGKEGKLEAVITDFSQRTLAEMVGTTRSRVSKFMNHFRNLGFIDYGHSRSIRIRNSLLKAFLQDSFDRGEKRGDMSVVGHHHLGIARRQA